MADVKSTGRVYLANAFSLSMLPSGFSGELCVQRGLKLEDVKELLKDGFTSAVGHSATADVLTKLLGLTVQTNRAMVTLAPGDVVVVFQLGVRLQEGQVLSSEEVNALFKQGKASFDLVKMGPCGQA